MQSPRLSRVPLRLSSKPHDSLRLRVSTGAQDTANQKHGVLEYCNANHLSGMTFIEDTAPGKTKWRNMSHFTHTVCQITN
uniref:Uncharacterized protein n=1 Tax=Candidatus Kentrum sp. FW TaxID=2126338 RepID=A0A450S7E9_9GAMM|nr:MAG: hypothetical protein BECKFW1821A_GA0114235_101734 [Candidatus Kentron sp. FW]